MTIYPTPRRNIQESKYLCISESHLQAYRLFIRGNRVLNSSNKRHEFRSWQSIFFRTRRILLAKLKNNILFLHQPTFYVASFCREFDTDFHYLSVVRLKRYSISLIMNLLESLFSRTVQLELEHIYILRSLNNGISSSLRTMNFGLRELPHQLEYQIDHNLIMAFGLIIQFIREIGKESLEAMHESIRISVFQFPNELTDVETLLVICNGSIERNQEIQKSIADLIVRISQLIYFESVIILLDGQITTLINQRNRIVRFSPILREIDGRSFHTIH